MWKCSFSEATQASEFSFVFTLYLCGDICMFEILCLTTVFNVLDHLYNFPTCKKKLFLTYFTLVLPLSRNHPIDLKCLLMTWFLYNDNNWLKCVKENLTDGLHIAPAWKPYLSSGKCFFSTAT